MSGGPIRSSVPIIGNVNAGAIAVYQYGPDGYLYQVDPTSTPVPAIIIGPLPTSDPHIVGALWANSSIVNISRG